MSRTTLEGDMLCELNGQRFAVTATDNRVIVSAPRWQTLWSIAKQLNQLAKHNGLQASGLPTMFAGRVQFQVNDTTLAQIGEGIHGGWTQLMGWPAVRLHPVAIAAAVLRGGRFGR